VAHTREEVTARRTEWDTAHRALLAAAGPEGVITGTDVNQARLTADALDTEALTERRETVRALEGALVRAESRVAHQHARSELALPAAAATSAVASATATQASRTPPPTHHTPQSCPPLPPPAPRFLMRRWPHRPSRGGGGCSVRGRTSRCRRRGGSRPWLRSPPTGRHTTSPAPTR